MKPGRKALHLFGRVALALLAGVLVFGTGVPLLHSDEWWIRLFDFPRIQIAILLGLTLAGYAALRLSGRLRPWEYTLAAMAGLALVGQLVILAPYTEFHPRQLANGRAEGNSSRISLLVHNVFADNREVAALRALIRDSDPDIILLSEPTQWWLDQLAGLEGDYPYTVFQPQGNEYGMLLYSGLELEDPEIRFLIEPDIPSIRTKVRLRSGAVVTIYGVHPRPPGPEEEGGAQEDGEREDSDVRDAELLSIAREVSELGDAPVIVAGDFNDLPWSHTIDQFQRIGGLLDPRVGRGMINTFPTTSRLLRYPLDQVFLSRHFRVVELRRLPDIDSDHFPVLVVFDHAGDASEAPEGPQP
jgi:endonuclease/exonuclease/phosphatase (EEP) superfamily protein YafD